jgi:DNA polymerase bacteriophage-type
MPRGLGEAVAAVNLDERKDPDGQRLINKLCKPMRRRRLTAAASDGLACQTVMWLEVAELWAPGSTITTQQTYSIARLVAEEHPTPVKDIDAAARTILHRKSEQGYFTRPSDGVYVWTDKQPVQIAAEDRRASYVDPDLSDAAAVQWCEEEIEHRRNWAYCGQDVRAERGLSEFCPDMTPRELDYWFMDFRMNDRGVQLDLTAAKEAVELCGQEVARLDAEMLDLTDGMVPGGSKRIPFRKWANVQIDLLARDGFDMPLLADTKADTLSFALYGVPTKAGEEAKAAHKDRMEELWASRGATGAKLYRSMEICLEVNRSSVAKYRQMVASVCPDGRLHDIMLYNGADRTGRWSGKGVQPHNFVRGYQEDMGVPTLVDKKQPELGFRPPVWDDLLYGWPGAQERKPDLDYVTIIWGDPLPVLAKACRGALTASPGNELYAADFNAIEARKLAWMSGCAPMLTLFQTGGDPYCDMASAIYKRLVTKADKSERQMGKKAVLGLGYAMGWEKFQATVWAEEGIWLEDEFCQFVVRIYRKEKCPEVPIFWKATERAAIAAVEAGGEHFAGGGVLGEGAISYFVDGPFLHCRLPSGRLLAYLYPEVHTKLTYRFNATNEKDKPCIVSFPAKVGVSMHRVKHHAEKMAIKQRKHLTGDPPESFLSPHLSFMGRNTYTRQWQRCGTHGGTLVENADQASSRDLLAEAMFRVDQDDRFDLLLSIHDEVIAEAPIGTCSLKEFEEIMSEVPSWAPGMPIAAEGWIGPRLRK